MEGYLLEAIIYLLFLLQWQVALSIFLRDRQPLEKKLQMQDRFTYEGKKNSCLHSF